MKQARSTTIILKNDSRIETHPLVFQPASTKKIYLGSRDTESFIIVDKTWELLIPLLKSPETIENIARNLEKLDSKKFPPKQSTSHVKVMTLHLLANGLIKSIDSQKIAVKSAVKHPRHTLKPSFFVKVLFSTPVLLLCLGFGLGAIVFIFLHPKLLPYPKDFFWHPRFSISFLTFFIVSWILGLGHELAHYLSASSQGIKSKIRLSHRLNFLVMETSYPNILSISKKWRIITFLAGIVFDLMVISALYLSIIYLPLSRPAVGLLKQIVLLQWLAVLWQFLFYMRTDMYFVIKELVSVDNLFVYAEEKIKAFFAREHFSPQLTRRESIIVNLYTLFFILGTAVAVVRYGIYQLPITVGLFIGGVGNLLNGYLTGNLANTIDGIIVLYIQALALLLLIRSIVRQQRV